MLPLTIAMLAPLHVDAQDATGARAAVEQIFEGMRKADPQLVRDVFAADARFAIVDEEGVRVQSVDAWLTAIGRSGGSWDERVYDVSVMTDGDMASVWAPYTFYLEGAISHCGVDSIELLRDRDGWKVTQLSDTRRSDGCPDPLGD